VYYAHSLNHDYDSKLFLQLAAVPLLSKYGVYILIYTSWAYMHIFSVVTAIFIGVTVYIFLPILHVYSDTYLPFRNLIWIFGNSSHRSSALCVTYYCTRCVMCPVRIGVLYMSMEFGFKVGQLD